MSEIKATKEYGIHSPFIIHCFHRQLIICGIIDSHGRENYFFNLKRKNDFLNTQRVKYITLSGLTKKIL